MAVTPEEVRHVAALARLRLEPDEVEEMTRQLNGILRHVDELKAVEVPEGGGGIDQADRAPLRPDAPAADPLAAEPATLAPEWDNGFFTVPRLESHEDEPAPSADERPSS